MPQTPSFSRYARTSVATPEALEMFAKAEAEQRARAKVAEASIPYESRDDAAQYAAQAAREAAARAKVAEAMVPMEYRSRPGAYVDPDSAPLKDDKQGLDFASVLTYGIPVAIGAGLGALIGNQYPKKIGTYPGAGIGALGALGVFLAYTQFAKK